VIEVESIYLYGVPGRWSGMRLVVMMVIVMLEKMEYVHTYGALTYSRSMVDRISGSCNRYRWLVTLVLVGEPYR
jgi:hypothetical protein